MTLKNMLQYIYPNFFLVNFKKKIYTDDISVLFGYKDGIELVNTNRYKKCCYPVLASLIVNYKEQALITSIKTNTQCSICYVLPKKKRLIT